MIESFDEFRGDRDGVGWVGVHFGINHSDLHVRQMVLCLWASWSQSKSSRHCLTKSSRAFTLEASCLTALRLSSSPNAKIMESTSSDTGSWLVFMVSSDLVISVARLFRSVLFHRRSFVFYSYALHFFSARGISVALLFHSTREHFQFVSMRRTADPFRFWSHQISSSSFARCSLPRCSRSVPCCANPMLFMSVHIRSFSFPSCSGSFRVPSCPTLSKSVLSVAFPCRF